MIVYSWVKFDREGLVFWWWPWAACGLWITQDGHPCWGIRHSRTALQDWIPWRIVFHSRPISSSHLCNCSFIATG